MTAPTRSQIQEKLAQESDPVALVRKQLFMRAFNTEKPYETDLYKDLLALQPVQISGEHRGDAHEFLSAELQPPYAALRDMMVTLQKSFESNPLEGEAIVAYIDRLVALGTKEYIAAKPTI